MTAPVFIAIHHCTAPEDPPALLNVARIVGVVCDSRFHTTRILLEDGEVFSPYESAQAIGRLLREAGAIVKSLE